MLRTSIAVVLVTVCSLSPASHAERKRSARPTPSSSRADVLIDQAVAESTQSRTQPAVPVPEPAQGPAFPSPTIPGERKPITGLVIGGSTLLGGTWLLTTSVALGLFGTKDAWYSAIPLFGPFVQMAYIRDEDLKLIFNPLLVLSGMWQLAGLGMLIGGAIGRPADPSPHATLQVVPVLSGGHSGLALVGRF